MIFLSKNSFNVFWLLVTLFLSFQGFAKDNNDYEQALKSFYAENYAATIIHLKNTLRADEEHIPSHLLLAKTFVAQGKGALAETELTDLQSMGVEFNQLIILLGQSYILQDKYPRVIDNITSGFRGNDIESQVQFIRGQAYIGLKQNKLAEVAFSEAINLQSDFPMARLGLAQVAIKRNKFDRAMRYVDDAIASYLPLPNAWILKSLLFQIQGKNNNAMDAINKALELSPNHMQARLSRASLYLGQNDFEEAKIDLDFILAEIPAEPRAKYLKAVVDAALGDAKSSKNKLSEVLVTLNAVPEQVMENNSNYYYLAGLTNYQFGNFDDAKRYLRSFLQQKENDFSTLRLLAMIEMQQGDFVTAKSILTKANVYYPDDPNILTLLGSVAMQVNNIELANRYFKRVVELQPDYSPALANLARSDMAAGNYHEAIEHLALSPLQNQLEQLDEKNTAVILLLVESYIKSKQYDKAEVITESLVKIDSKNSFYHQQHAIVLGLSGKNVDARKYLNMALTLDKNNIEAIVHMARLDVIEEDFLSAQERLKKALTRFPENIFLTVEVADVLNFSGKKSESLSWYEKAFSYDQQNSFALKKLVKNLVANNENNKAESILKSYILKENEDANAQVMLGQLYLTMNQPHKAIDNFRLASNKAKDRTQVLMHLANAHLTIDNHVLAIQSLNKAIALDSERLEPLLMLFPLLLKNGDETRAKNLIYSIEKLTPKKPLADILTARLAMSLKQYELAELHFIKANKLHANQKSVLGLFQALSLQNKHVKAGEVIRKWLKRNPNDVIAEISLAENYSNLGQTNKVATLYVQLLDKYNRMPILLNNAANILYQNKNIKVKHQALLYAKEAFEKAPKNVDVIDTLAWIESRNGNYQIALPLFRDALLVDFSNPEVKYHLAMTLSKEKRQNEAQKLLIEAVQSDRDFNEKAQARALLKQWLKR